MNERLSLLTMIIIGEGVIGASKTVGYLWPTGSSPTVGNLIAILSIVILLVRFSTPGFQTRRTNLNRFCFGKLTLIITPTATTAQLNINGGHYPIFSSTLASLV